MQRKFACSIPQFKSKVSLVQASVPVTRALLVIPARQIQTGVALQWYDNCFRKCCQSVHQNEIPGPALGNELLPMPEDILPEAASRPVLSVDDESHILDYSVIS